MIWLVFPKTGGGARSAVCLARASPRPSFTLLSAIVATPKALASQSLGGPGPAGAGRDLTRFHDKEVCVCLSANCRLRNAGQAPAQGATPFFEGGNTRAFEFHRFSTPIRAFCPARWRANSMMLRSMDCSHFPVPDGFQWHWSVSRAPVSTRYLDVPDWD